MLVDSTFQIVALVCMVASAVARPPPTLGRLNLPQENRHYAIRREHNTTASSSTLSAYTSLNTLSLNTTHTHTPHNSATEIPNATVIPTMSAQNTAVSVSGTTSPTPTPPSPIWTNTTQPSPASPSLATIILKDEQNFEYPLTIPTTNSWTTTNVIQSITHLSFIADPSTACVLIGIDGLALALTSQTPNDMIVTPPQTIVGGLCGALSEDPYYGPNYGDSCNATSQTSPSSTSTPNYSTGDGKSSTTGKTPENAAVNLFALLGHASKANAARKS